MSERRYDEEEVAAIFEKAAAVQEKGGRRLAGSAGMTLAQLQDIGREAGLSPEAVAHAAGALDRAPQPTSRRFLGLPLGVGRVVELPRRLTDAEWERLVVDLRETFDARGHVSGHGSFRQWTNGNLQALLEPTETGHRLRLRTMKGNSRAAMTTGLGMLGIAAASLAATAATIGLNADAMLTLGNLGLIGAGLFGFGALRLPSWARERRQQMEDVSVRLMAAIREEPGDQP